MLVKERAKVNIQIANGCTPLIVHTGRGNKEVALELIDLKANVDLQDNEGWSALMVASNKQYVEIVQCLVYTLVLFLIF